METTSYPLNETRPGPSLGNRPALLMIDLDALRFNFERVRAKAGGGMEIIPIVKANAYGLGAAPISRTLQALGADAFGVASCGEGVLLREGGIHRPILVLGGIYPDEGALVKRYGLTPVVFSEESLRVATEEARAAGARFRVHLKVDTGMNRIGVKPSEAPDICMRIQNEGVLLLDGIMSHFATVGPGLGPTAREQIEKLRLCVHQIHRLGIKPRTIHIANSAAMIASDEPLFNAVRPGIILFGSLPSEALRGTMEVKPVVKLVTRIIQVNTLPPGEPISYGGTFVTQR